MAHEIRFWKTRQTSRSLLVRCCFSRFLSVSLALSQRRRHCFSTKCMPQPFCLSHPALSVSFLLSTCPPVLASASTSKSMPLHCRAASAARPCQHFKLVRPARSASIKGDVFTRDSQASRELQGQPVKQSQTAEQVMMMTPLLDQAAVNMCQGRYPHVLKATSRIKALSMNHVALLLMSTARCNDEVNQRAP